MEDVRKAEMGMGGSARGGGVSAGEGSERREGGGVSAEGGGVRAGGVSAGGVSAAGSLQIGVFEQAGGHQSVHRAMDPF